MTEPDSGLFRRFAWVAGAWLAIDQITKVVARAKLEGVPPYQSVALWPDVVHLYWLDNPSGPFGLLSSSPLEFQRVAFTVLALGFAAYVVWIVRRTSATEEIVPLALLTSGVLGNALDRIVHGAVGDFIVLAFSDGALGRTSLNVADIAIVAGLVALVWVRFSDGAPVRAIRSLRLVAEPSGLRSAGQPLRAQRHTPTDG